MDDRSTTVGELRELVARFVAERDWQRFHDPKNLSMALAIEAAELMEHFQWFRSEQLDEIRKDAKAVAAIGDELADVLAFALSFANAMQIDISSTLSEKMVRNAKKYPADQFRGRFRA